MPAGPIIEQIGGFGVGKVICMDCNWSQTNTDKPMNLAQDHARHYKHRTAMMTFTTVFYGPVLPPVPKNGTPDAT